MNILFDTNIILDIALKRMPFFTDSFKILHKIGETHATGFVTASTITDIYYISKKQVGHQLTKDFLLELIQFLEVIAVDKLVITEALMSDMPDFEDAVQAKSAVNNDIEVIVTRNKKDFSDSGLQIFTPEELIEKLEKS